MIRIGDSYIGHQKLIGDNGFASGSELVGWEKPSDELLNLLRDTTEKMGMRCMTLDIFETLDGSFYINEMQAIIGAYRPYQMKIDGKPGRFIYKDGAFKFEEGIHCQNACEELFDIGDVWLLPKPEKEDYKYFSEGKILWGWPHCVQGFDIAQAAIDAKMTIVAWEAMYGGLDKTHIFYRNNELAGYAAVQHMMMLTGKTGYFGRKLKAAVLGFGATARGAINCLKSLGIVDITVYSQRPSFLINAPIESISYKQLRKIDGSTLLESEKYQQFSKAAEVLSEYDVVVNCVLQNPIDPVMFIEENDIKIQTGE